MEKYRQAIIPEDSFAPEAVNQYLAENPDSDDVLTTALVESARLLVEGQIHPREQVMIRQFLVAMIGFGNGRIP